MKHASVFALLFTMISCSNENLLNCEYKNELLRQFKDSLYTQMETSEGSLDFQKHDDIILENGREYTFVYKLSRSDTNYLITKDSLIKHDEIKKEGYLKKIIYSAIDTFKLSYSSYPDMTLYGFYYYNNYDSIIFSTETGAIENHQNYWIHPPIFSVMKSTFAMPWPFIRLDTKKGETFLWSHKISDFFSANYLNPFEGYLTMNCLYENKGEEQFELYNGSEIEVTKIEATNTEKTDSQEKVTYYFNCNLGFVKSVYEFDDDWKLEIYLSDHR